MLRTLIAGCIDDLIALTLELGNTWWATPFNTWVDIAKIESGQFTLSMTKYAIESVVETVRAAS